jgi:adiponectin receptor
MYRDVEYGYAPGDGWARNQLLNIDDLPKWYEPLSPFVISGYRPPGLSLRRCAGTVCEKHNETGNIWTHLIGGVVWIAVCMDALLAPDLSMRADAFTYRLHWCGYFMCGFMPFFSTCAHLFHCQSSWWYTMCWDMDHVGIIALWYARALCEGYALMFCDQILWNSWAVVTTFVFVLCTYIVVQSHSTVLFLPLYAWIHLPIVHTATFDNAFWAEEGVSPLGSLGEALRSSVALTLVGSLCGVFGYAIMVTKVPESIWPGRFDYWFHSHQWWHILTAVGPVICMEAGRSMLAARLDFTCDHNGAHIQEATVIF